MNASWAPRAIIRAASFVAPRDRRSDWIEEWRSELWYVPPYHATRFCMGAFQDALWLRRNNRERRDSAYLDSAASCLASLAALAALSLLISAACLLGPLHSTTSYWRLTPGDLPGACVLMLAYTGVLLPITALAMRRAGFSSPNPGRLRRALFFIVKTALVQPIMLCAFFVSLLLGPVAPLASQLGMLAMWILACRWLIADQRRRCPVCLRLLTQTVRIGTASQTFLEWYGAESLCSRGHGLLHLPETQTTYNAGPQWLRLGDSWSGVFGR